MLKILQARLQQYMNQELPVQKGFRGGSVSYGLGLPVGLSARTWELNDLGLGYEEEEGKGVNKDTGREKQKTKD